MKQTNEGKLLIERQKSDDHVHKHFKEKFQSKEKELEEIKQTEQEEDEVPAISERTKKTISNEPTETETKKAIEKLKDTSPPGPEFITDNQRNYCEKDYQQISISCTFNTIMAS